MPTSLPITDPVLIFAIAMGIFLAAPIVFQRIRVPGVVGIILLGAIVGPNVLNLLARDFTFELLGQVGLLYLVFLAGLELDLNRFREYRKQSVLFGILSFGIPMVLALLIVPFLGYGIQAAALVGAIVGSHTLLAYPVASRLGILGNRAIVTVIGGTLVTDALSLAVLAVVTGSMETGGGAVFWMTRFGLLALYVALVLLFIPLIGRWFFRNVPAQAPAEFLFLMVILFLAAWTAKLAGAQPIIGAFLAGLTLNRLIPLVSPLMTRVRFVGNALFIPFFLLSVGMLVNPRILVEGAEVWILAGTLTALVVLGKWGGAEAARRLFRLSRAEGMAMWGLSVPQAAATLAVTFVGLEIGLLGESFVNAVILLILATVFLGPSLVERYGREIALQEEGRAYDPRDAPQRILIPISNPTTADGLMDIALLLRGKNATEPIYPLMVVRPSEGSSEALVAESEKMLSHAVLYAAGADAPVSPLTRVDANVASGIARAIAEIRGSLVVVGWDGLRSGGGGSAVFGSVLDQLLEQSRQTVIVAKLGHPLNTTQRLLLVVPPASHRHPGFVAAMTAAKTLAARLDARFELLVVAEPPERYLAWTGELAPEIPVTASGVEGWGPLLWELRSKLTPQDLVAVLSARRGNVSWHRELEQLPGQLSSLAPESFLVIYPSEVGEGSGDEASIDGILPAALTPERVVFGLPAGPFEEGMRTLLATRFAGEPHLLEQILSDLVHAEGEFSSELRAGMTLPHALVPGLAQPLMFLGFAPGGLTFPRARGPVHLVLILLGSAQRPHDHLHLLTRMAGILRSAEDADGLRGVTGLEELFAWFARAEKGRARKP